MVELPDRAELVGIAGLAVGFVLFTFATLGYFLGGGGSGAVVLVVAGGLLGFAAAVYLVFYYHVVAMVSGA